MFKLLIIVFAVCAITRLAAYPSHHLNRRQAYLDKLSRLYLANGNEDEANEISSIPNHSDLPNSSEEDRFSSKVKAISDSVTSSEESDEKFESKYVVKSPESIDFGTVTNTNDQDFIKELQKEENLANIPQISVPENTESIEKSSETAASPVIVSITDVQPLSQSSITGESFPVEDVNPDTKVQYLPVETDHGQQVNMQIENPDIDRSQVLLTPETAFIQIFSDDKIFVTDNQQPIEVTPESVSHRINEASNEATTSEVSGLAILSDSGVVANDETQTEIVPEIQPLFFEASGNDPINNDGFSGTEIPLLQDSEKGEEHRIVEDPVTLNPVLVYDPVTEQQNDQSTDQDIQQFSLKGAAHDTVTLSDSFVEEPSELNDSTNRQYESSGTQQTTASSDPAVAIFETEQFQVKAQDSTDSFPINDATETTS